MNNFCPHGNKTKQKPHCFLSTCFWRSVPHVFLLYLIRNKRLCCFFQEGSCSQERFQTYLIPIYEIIAKDKSSKKTTDRRCIEKLMRIKHDCLLKKEEEEYQTVCLFKKGKKSHYKNTQGVSLSFFNKKKCEVSDSVP